jgi:hypothetical protein
VKGSKLRHAHRMMTLKEVWNDFVGVAQTGGAKTFRARLFLTPNRQKSRGRRRFIGATQGATFAIEIEEAATIAAGALNLSRTAAGKFVMRVVPAYRVGPDQFSHLPFYRETNRDALDLTGPDGKMLMVWDDNAAFAATQIGKYSLSIGDDELFHQVEPRYVDEEYARMIDAGGSDATDEVTALYAADPFAPEEELPTGPVNLQLVNQDVPTLKGRFLYLPTVDEAQATQIATEAAALRGEAVNATLPAPASDATTNGSQSVAPIEFIARADARFDSEPGIMATVGGTAKVFVPQTTQAIANGIGSKPLVARLQKLTGLRIPGMTSSSGKGRRGAARSVVRAVFASHF